MKINTHQFGEIEFEEENIIAFDHGLPGFEKMKRYLLIRTEDELFHWLNSVEDPELCFPLVGARIIDENYPEIEGHEAFGIVTLNEDPAKTTINLKAPVYIDQNKKTGFQKIMEDDSYSINYNLFVENKNADTN